MNCKIGVIFVCMLPLFVGAAMLWENIIGYRNKVSDETKQYLGWPLNITVWNTWNYEDASIDGVPDDIYWSNFSGSPKGLGTYAAITNTVFSLAMLYCTFLATRIIRRSMNNRLQFSIKGLLILTTAVAMLCSMIVAIDFWPEWFPGQRITNEYIYQPLHKIPLYLQIPLWFGLFCTAAVLATAMIDGVRFLVTRKDRSTEQ
jgi:hypothetical protein